MVSQLFLDIPHINNTKILRIKDSSYYNENIEVSCGQILITPPGFSYPVGFNVDPYFSIVLNSASLGLSETTRNDFLDDIADGIYIIHYSVSPNDQIFVEYNHMRTALLEKDYYENLCSLYTREGSFRTDEFNNKLKELKAIERLIKASVILVEEKHFNEKGIELYQRAEKLLKKYKSSLTKCKTC